MITKILWKVFVLDDYKDLQEEGFSLFFILTSLLLSLFTLPIDLILLPLELIALIVHFIINRRYNKCQFKI